MTLLRNLVLLAVSLVLSYWLLLYEEGEPLIPRPKPQKRSETLAVAPKVKEREQKKQAVMPLPPPPSNDSDEKKPEKEPEKKPDPAPKPAAKPEGAPPPPPEKGDPDAKGDEGDAVKESKEAEAARIREEIRAISGSKKLLGAARDELAGKTRHGFTQQLLSVPEDAVAQARFFGEQILLIPKAGTHYFRLELEPAVKVVRVEGSPPLAQVARHRDYLKNYRYEDLSAPLRALRRMEPNRSQIWLFGATIPPREWALVVARRQAALEQYNKETGKTETLDSVRHVLMRYVPLHGGGFDIRVVELRFADGTRWTREEKS